MQAAMWTSTQAPLLVESKQRHMPMTKAHAESTAFTSRSTASFEMSGQMKNWLKRSNASSSASTFTSK